MTTPFPDITVIVGSGRSGTTYLGRVVQLSLDIEIPPEPKFVVPTYRQLKHFGDLTEEKNLRRLVEKIHAGQLFEWFHSRIKGDTTADDVMERVLEPSYSGVLYAVFQLLADKRQLPRLGYKDPADVVHLPLLATLLPTARFVHVIRDGRDVALSFLKFRWGHTNVYCGSRYWARSVAVGMDDGLTLGDRYHEFRLEDLLFDTERVASELGHFVNRGANPDQVEKLVQFVQETKTPEIAYRWKDVLSQRERYLCEGVAGNVLRRCGYETDFGENARVSPFTSAYYHGRNFVGRSVNALRRKFAGRAAEM